MPKKTLLPIIAGLLVAASLVNLEPPAAQAARNRSSARWGGGTSRYGYYPSRRKKGMKQLGPVPALGGVRAMPYWGGER